MRGHYKKSYRSRSFGRKARKSRKARTHAKYRAPMSNRIGDRL